MKKLITICLLATMGAFEAQAQDTYENEVINTELPNYTKLIKV